MIIREFLELDETVQRAICTASAQQLDDERFINARILIDNKLDVVLAFIVATEKLLNAGFRHYGARGIGEHLRFQTALRDRHDVTFKLNNNDWPVLGRLCLALFPEQLCSGDKPFFECRDRYGNTDEVA